MRHRLLSWVVHREGHEGSQEVTGPTHQGALNVHCLETSIHRKTGSPLLLRLFPVTYSRVRWSGDLVQAAL